MILVTGDTHGFNDVDKIIKLKEKNTLSKNDYLIIAGDFGGIWDKYSINKTVQFYRNMPFTVLFVDGNHENFNLLNSYPIDEWKGGKIHRISENLIHLMRGQVYTIEGKTFFIMGGGTSIDKDYRIEHISWWKEEIPSIDEINEAKRNLLAHNNKVDYIITHSCDTNSLNCPLIFFKGNKCIEHEDNKILDYYEENIKYKHWYFGHFHVDGDINNRKTVLYNEFRIIK